MKKGNIQQNKLSLKALQEQIERLSVPIKAQGIPYYGTPLSSPKVEEQIKLNRVNPVFRFIKFLYSPFFLLFTWTLVNLNRVPGLKQLFGFIGVWYSRSRWFQLLLTCRRYFLFIHAFFAVICLFDWIGFDVDTIIQNSLVLGVGYLDMLRRWTFWLFRKIYEIFTTRS